MLRRLVQDKALNWGRRKDKLEVFIDDKGFPVDCAINDLG